MTLLAKDHKPPGADGLISTQPVVSACTGMNVPMNDLLSELLEPIAMYMGDSGEVVSSENMLNLIDNLNTEWKAEGNKQE